MRVGFYGHVRQYESVRSEIDAKMQEVLMSGKYVMGPMLARFEQELAEYMGMKHAVGVGNGTDAIWLTLMALGVGKGDEVITHPNTFFATAEAAWIAGCKVVFVDCDPKTKNIDPAKIEAAITRRTRAIIPVHLYGQCADMPAIKAIADKHKLLVIEDNAQGIDGRGKSFKQGELSEAVTISFIIQKNLGCFGDGGAIVTDNEEIDRKVRILRNHGSKKRSWHSPGYNSRLDDLQAAILSAKLKHITEWTDRRIAIAARYSEGLKGARSIELPYTTPGYRHVFHLYVIETKGAEKRDHLLKFLNDSGIDAKCHYDIAIHQQDGFPWDVDVQVAGSVKNAEKNAASCVSLPMFPELKDDEVDYVVEKVLEWDGDNR
jgi:dTDP-4-amino-4,6-dideoxygalactose transaminase